jgi:hypothetical protein
MAAAVAAIAAPSAAVAASGAAPRAASLPTSFELLGVAEIPAGTTVDGAPVGGLSGLVWNELTGSFVAISDDRSELAPARMVRLEIRLDDGRLAGDGVRAVASQTLYGRNGRPFAKRSLDPEGIAASAHGYFVSSEGDTKAGIAPFVIEVDPSGRFLRELPLPKRFLPGVDAGGHAVGVRNNLGFEALAGTPDGRYLWSGTENGLAGESAAAAPGVSSVCRLLRWDLAGDAEVAAPPREMLYRAEAIRLTPPSPTDFLVNGLVELVALDGENLLALEREYVPGAGLSLRLYAVDVTGLPDVAAVDPPATADLPSARKTLLLDFADLGIALDNYEGMAFGPSLSDGRRTLFVVSDDNFDPGAQKTLVAGFAVGFEPLTVAGLQGAGHRSPLAGRFVAGLDGVVTAIEDTRRSRGFWMESDRPDADPATSEGIFVDWEGASTLMAGQKVRVGGKIEERDSPKNLPVTTLKLTALEPLGDSAELPRPPRLGADRRIPPVVEDDAMSLFDPANDALDFWESLESMRVEVPPGTVIGPTRDFGEIVLLPDGAEVEARTAPGGVLFTSSRVELDRFPVGKRIAGKMPDFAVGARIDRSFVGIVDYGFSIYRVQALAPPAPPPAAAPCGETTALRGGKAGLTLATLNVENLSLAGGAERIARFGRVIVAELGSPAILAVEEIQDDSGVADDGVVSSRATVDALLAAIVAAGGPRYEAAWIDPENGVDGGQPGGNIRVVLLSDPLRAKLVRRGAGGATDSTAITGEGRKTSLTLSPGRLAATSPAFGNPGGEGVRKSLAAEYRVGRQTLFVVANHLSSKYQDDRLFGPRQPLVTPTGAKRLQQTRELRSFSEALFAADPKAKLVILGDLNEPEWAEGVAGLSRPPLVNLMTKLPVEDRYTYNFEGLSQTIDHIIVSPALANGAEIDAVHRNSDCPDSLRVSDHDPVVARLKLR